MKGIKKLFFSDFCKFFSTLNSSSKSESLFSASVFFLIINSELIKFPFIYIFISKKSLKDSLLYTIPIISFF